MKSATLKSSGIDGSLILHLQRAYGTIKEEDNNYNGNTKLAKIAILLILFLVSCSTPLIR